MYSISDAVCESRIHIDSVVAYVRTVCAVAEAFNKNIAEESSAIDYVRVMLSSRLIRSSTGG